MLPIHVIIRDESEKDIDAISEVTAAAFKCLEVSRHTEQFIIEALRATSALTLSLVAELDGKVVGHVAFSPVTISDGTPDWYALGPISVLPGYQRQGIGKALIWEGLATGSCWRRPPRVRPPCGCHGCPPAGRSRGRAPASRRSWPGRP